MRAGWIAWVLVLGCTSSGRDGRGGGSPRDAGVEIAPETDGGAGPDAWMSVPDGGGISPVDTGPPDPAPPDAGPPDPLPPDAGPPDAGPPPAMRCVSSRESCDDGDPCTTDVCDVYARRCVHDTIPRCCRSSAECTVAGRCMTPICRGQCSAYETGDGCCTADADCEDGDPCTRDTCFGVGFPGFPPLCQHEPVGENRDGDGALAIDPLRGCGSDCEDTLAGVHPGVTAFSPLAYRASDGSDSFDYDCDGVARPELEQVTNGARCALSSTPGKYCVATNGWVDGIAACGVTALWRECRYDISTRPHCFESFSMRTQGCR